MKKVTLSAKEAEYLAKELEGSLAWAKETGAKWKRDCQFVPQRQKTILAVVPAILAKLK